MAYSFRIVERRLLTSSAIEIVLAPSADFFKFVPGQYIELHYAGDHRSLSLAAAPAADGSLTLAFRHSPSRFKQALLAAPLGALVTVEGPYGVFTVTPDLEPVAFIAGGIGITPFRAMLQVGQTASLLYANQSEGRAAYLGELRERAQSKQITLLEHYGLVDTQAVARLLSTSCAKTYFVAGPTTMVNNTMELLLEQGVTRQQMLLEQFTGL